jgi:8-oxo-dGTP pyrophosphatase MutT (NUDIX family)
MQDHSYGIIPVFFGEGEPLYLLVKKADGVWGFPKGHKEEGESDTVTALRELKEEAGIELDPSELLPQTVSEKYTYTRGGTLFDKSVEYRIGKARSMEAVIDNREIVDSVWLPFDKALARISYPESQSVLREAKVILEKEVN